MRPVLITAGATRNPIDAIRFLSASASGRTGVTVATALSSSGATVDLLASPEAALRAPPELATTVYGSTRDLMARMQAWLAAHPTGVVLHSCAVGDYEAATEGGKLPSGQDALVLRLTPTPKILDQLKKWAPGCRVVSFKAAPPQTLPPQLVAIARRQLVRSGSDLVFANVIGALGHSVWLVDAEGAQPFDDRAVAINALIKRVRGWL
jgi:phosphopantothenate---cysteine ligase (CTP)